MATYEIVIQKNLISLCFNYILKIIWSSLISQF